ncbi:MAG TPA: hypothetical protein VGB68_19725, partial [Pyrinomonadaceae bacterium]
EMSRLQDAGAMGLSAPLTDRQKAEITHRLNRKGIINQLFEHPNQSNDERFEHILKEIRKVIGEVLGSPAASSSEQTALKENNKFSRTIWLSDTARKQIELGTKVYKTGSLMVQAVFGISQYWFELFTKGNQGTYVADYYGRHSAEQNYYYLPHNDRRFCHTTDADFLQTHDKISDFLKKRENHWRHLYAKEIILTDSRTEKILAYGYLNRNQKSAPIYLKRDDGDSFSIKLVINLSLDEEHFEDRNVEQIYNLTTALAYPLKIVLVLTRDENLYKCEDSSLLSLQTPPLTTPQSPQPENGNSQPPVSGEHESAVVVLPVAVTTATLPIPDALSASETGEIENFLNAHEGFELFSELKNSLQEAKARLVVELRNNCFVSDHNKDKVIERFLLEMLDAIIEQDINQKIEDEHQRGELISRLKECLQKIGSNYDYLRQHQTERLDEDILLMSRIKEELVKWIRRANQKQIEAEQRKNKRRISGAQPL